MSKYLLPLVLACATFATSLRAEPFASDWSKGQYAAARLIAVGQTVGVAQVGVEIALDPKTHTYWRVPGDAGVPPMLSFDGSSNLASAEVLFPAPERIVEENATVYGYETNVILPLTIVPKDKAKPVTLKVKMDYAACERTCAPVHADLVLVLPGNGKAGPYKAALGAALAQVPVVRIAGADGPLVIVGIAYGPGEGAVKPQFGVDVRIPQGAKKVTLLPLAADGWYLSTGPAIAINSGLWRFPVSVEEMPKSVTTGMIDTGFVLVADAVAIEVRTPLDAVRLKP